MPFMRVPSFKDSRNPSPCPSPLRGEREERRRI